MTLQLLCSQKYVFVKTDTIIPAIYITFDGKKILNGDYVSPEPEIFIEIVDNSFIGVEDTSLVSLYLNDNKIDKSGEDITFTYIAAEKKTNILYVPQLQTGTYTLKIEYSDLSGNSSEFEVVFKVETDLKIYNVFNYPNPFRYDTYFTFVITQPAELVRVRIFTTFGRLIKEIEDYNIAAGFNKIYWDGRDQDGDRIANSVYLYKIIIKSGDSSTEALQKLVIMR